MSDTTQEAQTSTEDQAIFDQQQGSLESGVAGPAGAAASGVEVAPQANEAQEVLVADPEDDTRVATITGEDAGMSEEELIAMMSAGDEIRDSQTVAAGRYIISVREIDLKSKAIKWVFKTDAAGNSRPVREKSVGFTYAIHYDLTNKEVMEDYGYQMFHLAKKDGSPNKSGQTDYKRFCADLSAAGLRANGQTEATLDAVLDHMNKNKLAPVVAFNSTAGSTEDNMRYFYAQIKVNPARDGYPESNELVVGSFKEGADEYMASL